MKFEDEHTFSVHFRQRIFSEISCRLFTRKLDDENRQKKTHTFLVHFRQSRRKILPEICSWGLCVQVFRIGWPQQSPIFGAPHQSHDRKVLENRKLKFMGQAFDLCRTVVRQENSDDLMSFQKRGIFHFCDLCRRCTGTEIISESPFLIF